MWEAYAEYEDGSSVRQLFSYNERVNENEQQWELECWLIERHPGCTFYTVNYVPEEDY